MEQISTLVEWSRAQFALTAMYHWIFVPLTLGMTFMIAFMETLYVRTGNEEWKRMTKFWAKLFGINFAIGVATGIILEFEFGTNWSNYSWFVGDIFGAPLAVEGIMAFFLESTFIAIMFFGWNKVSKKFHLLSTWLVAIGANLSALWILVANGWMQFPTGTVFNPDTARNEMVDFWAVLFSPISINKFLHTISSGFVLSAIFVIAISAWFMLKKREIVFAKKSILIAATFGLLSSLFLAFTGDGSAYQVAQKQPMKLAAMEGLYTGQKEAGLIVVGALTPGKQPGDSKSDYIFKIEIPKLLSLLGYRDANAFVPGINDLVYGNDEQGLISAQEKIERGTVAVETLKEYKMAKENGDSLKIADLRPLFDRNVATGQEFYNNYFRYFGYGHLEKPEDIVPNVPMVFYSFHIMVALGFFFILFFALMLLFAMKNTIEKRKFWLRLAPWVFPLGFIASQAGWIVAEVGRQPWVIQDLMPVNTAVSQISASAVQLTFILFAIIFTSLLIAEISIMTRAIKNGPTEGGK
ncbi:Cytochrome bd-I ubiquinol oxidase subunit 1 [bioreactor metagenome]|uniref:Cytochrome bd-I ubiquinol oxidase subunit 1 n=1 Tax=bioreactor metagenome TaxID=1076179 RepID=A0A644WSD2_9ZZZZ